MHQQEHDLFRCFPDVVALLGGVHEVTEYAYLWVQASDCRLDMPSQRTVHRVARRGPALGVLHHHAQLHYV